MTSHGPFQAPADLLSQNIPAPTEASGVHPGPKPDPSMKRLFAYHVPTLPALPPAPLPGLQHPLPPSAHLLLAVSFYPRTALCISIFL